MQVRAARRAPPRSSRPSAARRSRSGPGRRAGTRFRRVCAALPRSGDQAHVHGSTVPRADRCARCRRATRRVRNISSARSGGTGIADRVWRHVPGFIVEPVPRLRRGGRRARGRACSAPESGLFEDLDAAGFGDAMTKAVRATLTNPMAPVQAASQLAVDLAQIPLVAADPLVRPARPSRRSRSTPRTGGSPTRPGPTTRCSTAVRLTYLAACRFARDVVGGGRPGPGRRAQGGDGHRPDAGRAGADQLPADQPGRAQAGVRHRRAPAWSRAPGSSSTTWSTTRAGRARSTPAGSRWAATWPAPRRKVVYRNELMELIQYEPQTEQVHATPLLCSPPWINKYYVMDLAPGRSFIEWAVQHGRTVFAISYRNPSAGHVRHHDGRLPGARPEDRAGRDRGDHRRRAPSTSSGCASAARSPRSPPPT